MSKCIRCGGSFLTRRKVQLKDAEICGKCFKELGFDKSDLLTASVYAYDEIKDGRDAYYQNKRNKAASVSFAAHGEQRDLICTEEERMIYDKIEQICSGMQLPAPLQLVRVSENYVSAKIGDWDLARIKYTNRAKWIIFPIKSNDRLPIGAPEDVALFAQDIAESVEHIKKYW